MNQKIICLVLFFLFGRVLFAGERWKPSEQGGFVVEGKDLPKFECVRGFYNVALWCFRAGDDNFAGFLGELGIKTDSDAAKAIKKAMFLAQALALEEQEIAVVERSSPSAWDEAQQNFLRKRVLALKDIYQKMRRELEKLGVHMAQIETFMDNKVRDSIAMFATEPPVKELEIMDLFAK